MGSGLDVKSTTTRSDRRYERFLAKAEGYLLKYQASHSTPAPASGSYTPTNGGDHSGDGTRHLEFLKKAQNFMNKKDKKEGDGHHGGAEEHGTISSNGTNDNHHKNHKEHLKLAHALLKKIKKHKGKKGTSNNNEEEEAEEEEEEEDEEDEEEIEGEEGEEESHWFAELLTGISEAFEE